MATILDTIFFSWLSDFCIYDNRLEYQTRKVHPAFSIYPDMLKRPLPKIVKA